MITIVGKPKGELEIKRCYLQGVSLKVRCPACGAEWEDEFNGDDFNFPNMNAPEDLYLYCMECDHSWVEKVVLKVELCKG